METSSKHQQSGVELIINSLDVYRLSILTLVHRSSPRQSPTAASFNTDCIDSAKRAVSAIQGMVDLFHAKKPVIPPMMIFG